MKKRAFPQTAFCVLLCLCMLICSGLCACAPSGQDAQTTETPSVTTAQGDTVAPIDVFTTEEELTTASVQTTEPAETNGLFYYDPIQTDVQITAPFAILIDVKTNTILYMKGDGNTMIYPASTTKLLTALIALQYCEPDVKFTPGDELSFVPSDSSIAYIKSRHTLTLEMLIEGMMLPSGGDAAYVIAAGVGRIISGNVYATAREAVDAFVAKMNEYAAQVGMTNSHFTCPDGYHDNDHYTTLLDVMILAQLAEENEIIMKYAGTLSDDVTYASGHKNSWKNSNLLIDPDSEFYYQYATGIKTGTTDEAGCCVVASAAFGTKKVLVGIFGATTNAIRFNDAKALLALGIGEE